MERSRVARIEKVREMLRDVRRSELADADQSVNVARIELSRVQARATAASNELSRIEEISPTALEDRGSMVHAVRAKAREAAHEVGRREENRERMSQDLQSAEIELRSVSKLGERLEKEEARAQNSREQKALDERAVMRWRKA